MLMPASPRIPRHVRIVEVEPIFSVEHPAGVFLVRGEKAGGFGPLAHVRVRVEDRQGRVGSWLGRDFLRIRGHFREPISMPGAEGRADEGAGHRLWIAR